MAARALRRDPSAGQIPGSSQVPSSSPPRPRASAIVDPRIGDARAGAAGARGRHGLRGRGVRGAGRRRRRPRRQHQPDRLPGGLHRPVVRRPGRGHDLPAHRQLRAPLRRRPVGAAVAARASSWRTPRRPSSTTRASSRGSCATTGSRPSRAWTRGRLPGTCARTAACAGCSWSPGRLDRADRGRAARAAVPRWEDQDFVAEVSPAAVTEIGAGEDGPLVAIVDYGLKANIVRSLRRRGVRVRVLPHTVEPSDVLVERRRGRRPVARPGRPGAARRSGRAGPGGDRRRPAAARASASGTRSWAARRAPRRAGCGSATTARTTPSATSTPGSSRSPRRTTRSRSSARRCRADGGFHVSQVNLNDGSVEGLRHVELPIETVQYHPEGAPGPLDALAVFDRFVAQRCP